MVAILLLLFISLVMGCVTEKEVVYKTIYFADTNGVTTVYYPLSMEKDLITPHDDERWKYVASKDSPDKGIAKEMVITDEDMKRYSEEYHRLNPECTYDFQTYSH
jgi:hypothetical protein